MRTSDNFTPTAKISAWLAVIGFSIFGLIAIFGFNAKPDFYAIPIFYALLVLNTFFSVRVFASITPPKDPLQKILDLLLCVCFFFLAISFSNPTDFVLAALFLFIIATLKYILLISLVGSSKLILKKIRIDALGILLCTLCLLGILKGFTAISLNLFAFIFSLANIEVLWRKPLYRLEDHIKAEGGIYY